MIGLGRGAMVTLQKIEGGTNRGLHLCKAAQGRSWSITIISNLTLKHAAIDHRMQATSLARAVCFNMIFKFIKHYGRP